jgi:hypothetical protein
MLTALVHVLDVPTVARLIRDVALGQRVVALVNNARDDDAPLESRRSHCRINAAQQKGDHLALSARQNRFSAAS